MSNLVSQEWVLERIQSGNGQLVIADVRFQPGDAEYGISSYTMQHLPGAVFVDLKKDLTDHPGKHGGRSPLPDPQRLATTFGSLGIDRSTPVVIYDDDLRPEAARLWWILKYLGNEQAYILDGGFKGWAAAGLPLTAEDTEVTPRIFEVELRPELLADVNDVRAALDSRGEVTLIDSRDRKQYTGESAPLDPVAGHIPGAIHDFWKDGIQDNGSLKSPEVQKERFAGVDPDREVIVYCGSGLSACPNVLALQEAGYSNVRLYAGSWSDWISYEENPVATGKE